MCGGKITRAQASMEYIMIVAVITIIVIPTIWVFYSYSQSSTQQLSYGQVERIGNDIVNNAEKIYYQGPPSKITLEETMPGKVENITIISDWGANPHVNEIVFYINMNGKLSESVFSSKVNINGTFTQASFSEGVKKVVLEAKKAGGIVYVDVSIS